MEVFIFLTMMFYIFKALNIKHIPITQKKAEQPEEQ